MTQHRSYAAAPAALGASLAIIAQFAALRALVTADVRRVYVLGVPLDMRCALHERLGLPCPTCGITRGVALALHGDLGTAWRLFPAAPVAVLGFVALALALLGLVWLDLCGRPVLNFSRWLRGACLSYAAAGTVVWLVGWALALHRARNGM